MSNDYTLMRMPDIECYGSYRCSNYGIHTLVVDFGVVRVWYSYTTPVAFKVQSGMLVVRENNWSRTTGRHLTMIDHNRGGRVSGEVFQSEWDRQVAPYFDEDGVLIAAMGEAPPPEPANEQRPGAGKRKLLPFPALRLGK
jgi:hypothetical protein